MQIFEDFLNGPVFWTWELANDTVIMPWLAVQGSVNIPVQWGGHQGRSCDVFCVLKARVLQELGNQMRLGEMDRRTHATLNNNGLDVMVHLVVLIILLIDLESNQW